MANEPYSGAPEERDEGKPPEGTDIQEEWMEAPEPDLDINDIEDEYPPLDEDFIFPEVEQ
jgi:hypothetical protein